MKIIENYKNIIIKAKQIVNLKKSNVGFGN